MGLVPEKIFNFKREHYAKHREIEFDTLVQYDETKKFRIINHEGLLHDDVQQVINFVYTGGLTLTVDNVIRITRVAKSMKIKVLEDVLSITKRNTKHTSLEYIPGLLKSVYYHLFKPHFIT